MVIPAYDPGVELERAITSVLTQTMPDVEVVVLDDGSTEDLSWVGRHADPRVRFERQPNRGVSVARNVAVGLARAPWIAFLDQDDVWHPAKLEKQLAAVEAGEVSFCCTGFHWMLPGRPPQPAHGEVSYLGMLRDQHVCLSSVLLSRDRYLAVGGHDPLLRIMQDYDLFLRLLRDGPDAIVVPEVLVDYHVHAANASRDYHSALVERRSILRRHAWDARRRGRTDAERAVAAGLARTNQLFASQALEQARQARHAGRLSDALLHGWRSARWDPKALGRALAAHARG